MSLASEGYCFHNGFTPDEARLPMLAEISRSTLAFGAGGIRNANNKFPSISTYLASRLFKSTAAQYLTEQHQLMQVILFDKTPAANWLVAWHQDKTVAVKTRHDLPGWRNWSLKDGVHHVQPPLAVLESMVAIRIHLDDANEDNGCLKIIPRSHRRGLLQQDQIDAIARTEPPITCALPAGAALIMRPLILHASSKDTSPSHRRVMHLEFGGFDFKDLNG